MKWLERKTTAREEQTTRTNMEKCRKFIKLSGREAEKTPCLINYDTGQSGFFLLLLFAGLTISSGQFFIDKTSTVHFFHLSVVEPRQIFLLHVLAMKLKIEIGGNWLVF